MPHVVGESIKYHLFDNDLTRTFYQIYHLFEIQRVAYQGFRVLNEAFTIACPFALPLMP